MTSPPTAPLDYFSHAAGPAAYGTQQLGWVFTGICIAVCLIVTALLTFAILRRRPHEEARHIVHGGRGLHWIGVGTLISTIILFGMGLYALVVLNQAARPPQTPALTIQVTGYDWWWKAQYPATTNAPAFETANELHIPVGVPVMVELQSADVIHAFWVPQLAGKTQMIPGLTNHQWFQADKPGIYRGQCTQFCGQQHAHMAFEVVADMPDDFARWQAAQARDARPATAETQQGEKIFMNQCAGCHAVRGGDAHGGHGPNLTHLATRRLLAAGIMENNPDTRMDWVMHVQSIKPGARMPNFSLKQSEATSLSAYLNSLR